MKSSSREHRKASSVQVNDIPSEALDILEYQELGFKNVLIIIIVPSHDRNERPIRDQTKRTRQAMKLCAELWSGATAVRALSGLFRDPSSGTDLWDKPVLVQCYVDEDSAKDLQKLGRLVAFMKRMCRDTNQAAVAFVVADKFYTLKRERC
jgi:hypothetical protein